jgi:hypothetical protein
MEFSLHAYVQPHAAHEHHPERLLVQDTGGDWYLWFGDGRGTVAIAGDLARWIIGRPEMKQLHGPLHWFDLEALPLKVGLYDNERSVAD